MPIVQSALPEAIEAHRDKLWCREPELRIEDSLAAERLIERVGFCAALTDSRHPGPSLYIAVCGRRDAHTPRNVQKDPEVPYFNALAGSHRARIQPGLSEDAQSILKVLRKEWEMASRDLRRASGIHDRHSFNKAIDELQKAFKVIPSEVVYEPVLTYIWSLAEARFQDELKTKASREQALTEVARAYLSTAGMTLRGELARVTGLSNPDAGVGNWALVDEDFASRLAPGVYRLTELEV